MKIERKSERHIIRKQTLPWGGLVVLWVLLYAWDVQGIIFGAWFHHWGEIIFNIAMLLLATYMVSYTWGKYVKSRR